MSERENDNEADAGGRQLTARQRQFVQEYLLDLNQTAAATRAGYSARTANEQAVRLMKYPAVAAAIKEAMAARSQATQITAQNVLLRLWQIATADPNELVEYRRTCCRYCYGTAFRYQRTAGEMERDRNAWAERAAAAAKAGEPAPPPFDERGGIGYDPRRLPHEACPECFAEGLGITVVKDTRRLSPAAAALYAGIKETRHGIEVKMHDQRAALVDVGKHLGLWKEVGGAENPLTVNVIEVVRAAAAAAQAGAAGGLPLAVAGTPEIVNVPHAAQLPAAPEPEIHIERRAELSPGTFPDEGWQ